LFYCWHWAWGFAAPSLPKSPRICVWNVTGLSKNSLGRSGAMWRQAGRRSPHTITCRILRKRQRRSRSAAIAISHIRRRRQPLTLPGWASQVSIGATRPATMRMISPRARSAIINSGSTREKGNMEMFVTFQDFLLQIKPREPSYRACKKERPSMSRWPNPECIEQRGWRASEKSIGHTPFKRHDFC